MKTNTENVKLKTLCHAIHLVYLVNCLYKNNSCDKGHWIQ